MRYAFTFMVWAWGAFAVANYWWNNRTHFKYTKKDYAKYKAMGVSKKAKKVKSHNTKTRNRDGYLM